MNKESIFYKLLKKIGLIKTYEVNKKEMCENAKSICDKDCENCAWYEPNENIIHEEVENIDSLEETVVCAKCGQILKGDDIYITIGITGASPVKMKPGYAYGIYPGENSWNVCEQCCGEIRFDLRKKE